MWLVTMNSVRASPTPSLGINDVWKALDGSPRKHYLRPGSRNCFCTEFINRKGNASAIDMALGPFAAYYCDLIPLMKDLSCSSTADNTWYGLPREFRPDQELVGSKARADLQWKKLGQRSLRPAFVTFREPEWSGFPRSNMRNFPHAS